VETINERDIDFLAQEQTRMTSKKEVTGFRINVSGKLRKPSKIRCESGLSEDGFDTDLSSRANVQKRRSERHSNLNVRPRTGGIDDSLQNLIADHFGLTSRVFFQ
jgi:hypothetical protein